MQSLKLTLCQLAIVILSFLWLSSCTTTTTFEPVLNDKQAMIADSINSKYHFENININGKKTSGSGGDHTFLSIELINGKNIPADTAKVKILAKQLAGMIREALKTPKQFEGYKVMFDAKIVDGAVTTNRFVGYEFKASEL